MAFELSWHLRARRPVYRHFWHEMSPITGAEAGHAIGEPRASEYRNADYAISRGDRNAIACAHRRRRRYKKLEMRYYWSISSLL